jgi:hypothetical protein
LAKVLVETSALLAASIKGALESKLIQHKNYDISKSLLNFFQTHLTLSIGLITDTITEQSWRTLEKAIGDTVEESDKSSVEFFDIVSRLKDAMEDNLRKNIALLAKHPVDVIEVDNICTKEINSFFQKVDAEIRIKSTDHVPVQGIRLHQGTLRTIDKFCLPYYKGKPDKIDKRIFAEAVYLKRTFFKEQKMYLASLDTHFSPAKKDSVIRDKINQEFNIFCDWPSAIYIELKKEYAAQSKQKL